MSDLSPSGVPRVPSEPGLLAPLTDPAAGGALSRLRAFAAQPAVRKTAPWFGGLAALGGTALLWATLSPAPQRTLYSQLSDAEKGDVVAALDKSSIPYKIDDQTGAITVGEDDLYKARMLVASDGAIATPQTGDELLENMPMGASKTMEAERLHAARERELQLTIAEIDGVEAVRVHLAEAEKSVFVRDNVPPTASVMVKLARGRQLSDSQVSAIRNLVAGSVPGLTVDAVKVVDQTGRLLSADAAEGDGQRFDLQTRMEDKLRRQVSQLLTPMLGEGNFSSEIQVDLDMDEVTSARESYDKQGAVRSETQQASQTPAGTGAAGVPGVLSNTPPPPTTAQPGAPTGTPTAAPSTAPGTTGETSASRTYELGREVQVSNASPGKVRRLTVAVALSQEAMKQAKAQDIQQIKQLVSAAVGADPQRGDQVEVMVRSFQPDTMEAMPLWQTPWALAMVRYGVALLAVLLVLLLGVRPLVKALKGDTARPADKKEAAAEDAAADTATAEAEALEEALASSIDPDTGAIDHEQLGRQVGFAQRLAAEKPDSAVTALRALLSEPEPEAEGAR